MSSIVDSYFPEREIHWFWSSLQEKWALGAPRASDVDGREVFDDMTILIMKSGNA
jgi:hypothetical protein